MLTKRFVNLSRLCLAAILLASAGIGFAADDIRRELVQFKKGSNSTHIDGRIKGHETVDYIVSARAGQIINVSMATRHSAAYFNLMAPGESAMAFFKKNGEKRIIIFAQGNATGYKRALRTKIFFTRRKPMISMLFL
jgi:hypothetical protein